MIRPDAARALARSLLRPFTMQLGNFEPSQFSVDVAATLIINAVEADERVAAAERTAAIAFIPLADYAKAKARTKS